MTKPSSCHRNYAPLRLFPFLTFCNWTLIRLKFWLLFVIIFQIVSPTTLGHLQLTLKIQSEKKLFLMKISVFHQHIKSHVQSCYLQIRKTLKPMLPKHSWLTYSHFHFFSSTLLQFIIYPEWCSSCPSKVGLCSRMTSSKHLLSVVAGAFFFRGGYTKNQANTPVYLNKWKCLYLYLLNSMNICYNEMCLVKVS